MTSFRHSAGFGKRIEYWIAGQMLKEGLDVYMPLVDDHAVDAIIKRKDGTIAQVQIKARSWESLETSAGLFATVPHPKIRKDYWFVFYSERMEQMWIMRSKEFVRYSIQNKSGKNVGRRSIWFNGQRKNPSSGIREQNCKARFEKFLATDFARLGLGT